MDIGDLYTNTMEKEESKFRPQMFLTNEEWEEIVSEMDSIRNSDYDDMANYLRKVKVKTERY